MNRGWRSNLINRSLDYPALLCCCIPPTRIIFWRITGLFFFQQLKIKSQKRRSNSLVFNFVWIKIRSVHSEAPPPMWHCGSGGAGLPANNSLLSIRSPPSLSDLKSSFHHICPICAAFSSPDLLKRSAFILKVTSFKRATNRSEYNCPQSFSPRRIHAWVASNKDAPWQLEKKGAHNQLHRGELYRKRASLYHTVPLYNSTFPFNDTLHINPGQHPITQNQWIICASVQFENVFHVTQRWGRRAGGPFFKMFFYLLASIQRSLNCGELVSYFESINSKYRWFPAPPPSVLCRQDHRDSLSRSVTGV